MKRHLKSTFSLVFAAVLSFSVFANSYNMINVRAASPSENAYSDTEITPRKPNIGWRYKVENGKLYMRQYNYSTEQWIGDWILVP